MTYGYWGAPPPSLPPRTRRDRIAVAIFWLIIVPIACIIMAPAYLSWFLNPRSSK